MNFRRPSWSGFRPRPSKGYSYEDDAREASDDLDEEEPWPLPPKRLPKAPPKKAPPKGKGPKGPQGFKGPKAPEGPLAFWNERGDSRGRSKFLIKLNKCFQFYAAFTYFCGWQVTARKNGPLFARFRFFLKRIKLYTSV